MTLALVFFGAWIVWGLREVGPLGYGNELFAQKGKSAGAPRVLMTIVFFAAGCLTRRRRRTPANGPPRASATRSPTKKSRRSTPRWLGPWPAAR